MDESRVDKVVKDLVADHDRRDGVLSKSQVERLVEKRQLSVEEGAEVYRQLDSLGISLEEEPEEPGDQALAGIGSTESTAGDSSTVPEGLEARLRAMHSKLLTAEEEVELGRRMELGRRARRELERGIPVSDEHQRIIERATQATEAMILANLRLVLHVARPYVGLSDLTLDDLFQEGVMGLMRAAEKYDHTLGYKFSTYATWWIRQSVTRALADRGTTIRLPVYVYGDVLRLKRAHKLLSQAHPERRVAMGELADELNWTIDKVHFLQQVAAFIPASLDERLEGFDELTLVDTLVSDLPSPEDQLNRVELIECLDGALKALTERERDVICLRFGLNDSGDGATLEEIGRMYDLTRERIRQIEAKALKRLGHPNRSGVLRDYLDMT